MDDCEPRCLRQRPQFEAQPITQGFVQCGQRLVEQEGAWRSDKGPRQRDALSLTAGQRRRVAVLEARQSNQFQHLRNALRPFASWDSRQLEGVRNILADVPVRPQRMLLEHHAETAVLRRNRPSRPGDDIAGDRYGSRRRLEETCNCAQQRCLPGTRRPDQRQEFAVGDLEVDVLQAGVAAGVVEVDGMQFDGGHSCASFVRNGFVRPRPDRGLPYRRVRRGGRVQRPRCSPLPAAG